MSRAPHQKEEESFVVSAVLTTGQHHWLHISLKDTLYARPAETMGTNTLTPKALCYLAPVANATDGDREIVAIALLRRSTVMVKKNGRQIYKQEMVKISIKTFWQKSRFDDKTSNFSLHN